MEENVEEWHLFRIVADPEQADVVLVVAVWNRNVPVDRVGGKMVALKGGPGWSDQPRVLWESGEAAAPYGVSNPLASKLKKFLRQIGRQDLK